MKKQFIIFTTVLILGATAGLAIATPANTKTMSSGWQLTLNQNITIPAQSVGIYLQHGKVTSETETDQYYPNCRLEVRNLQDKSQTITADTFTVYRVKWTEEDVLLHSNQYASTGMLPVSSSTADDYVTTLYLRSERQPNVTRLICSYWEDPTGFAEHLNVKQIRSALGKIFTLQPKNK